MRSFTHFYAALIFVLLSGGMNYLGSGTVQMVPLANAAIIPRGNMNLRSLRLSRLDSRHFNDSQTDPEADDHVTVGEEAVRARAHVEVVSGTETVRSGGGIRREQGGERRSQGREHGRGRLVAHRRVHPRDFRMKRFVMEE